jgi:plasmid stabilization system protein ParE
MAARKIVWTITAFNQQQKILEYWAERNDSFNYSRKLLTLFQKHTKSLIIHPKLGKRTVHSNNRVITTGHYNIYYKISKKHIVITSIWDNRQNPRSLLKTLRRNSGFDYE